MGGHFLEYRCAARFGLCVRSKQMMGSFYVFATAGEERSLLLNRSSVFDWSMNTTWISAGKVRECDLFADVFRSRLA